MIETNSSQRHTTQDIIIEEHITPNSDLSTNNTQIRKWIDENDIEYPSYYDIFCYYFKSMFNNNTNKFQYLKFKSKIYTLINRSTIIFAEIQDARNNFDEEDNFNNNEIDNEIIKIFHLSDKYLKDNSKLLALSQAPLKEFIKNYIHKRNILLKLDDNFKNKYIYDRFQIAKKTTYLVNQLEILCESLKSSIEKNDETLFKLLVITMNFFILLGEYLWKYYWVDGSDSYGNN